MTNQFRSSKFASSLAPACSVAFLYGPGETIRDKPDVAAGCGEPPAKRHPKIKGEPWILRPLRRTQDFASRRSFALTRSGFRQRAQTPAKRLNLPVTILRGITRSHPEHG